MPIMKIAVAWARRAAGNRWLIAPRQGLTHQVPKKLKGMENRKAVGTPMPKAEKAMPCGQRK
ncbi:hypothetical protein D3C75_1250860 [compost metagenome]